MQCLWKSIISCKDKKLQSIEPNINLISVYKSNS